jgi:hypothetical protein
MEQAGEQRALGVGERGLADLALQDQQLMSQREDLDVFVSRAHRQEPQKREGVGHGKVGQSSTTGHDAAAPCPGEAGGARSRCGQRSVIKAPHLGG